MYRLGSGLRLAIRRSFRNFNVAEIMSCSPGSWLESEFSTILRKSSELKSSDPSTLVDMIDGSAKSRLAFKGYDAALPYSSPKSP